MKQRRKKGFTLVEMLAVVLILVLVTSVVAAGVPVARQAYLRVTEQANAQMVLSAAMTCIRDELWMAGNISVSPEGTISYGHSGEINPEGIQSLLGGAAVYDGLRVTYSAACFADGVVTISGLAVSRDGDELASVPEFCVRVVAND